MTKFGSLDIIIYDKSRLSQTREFFMTLVQAPTYEIADAELMAEKVKGYIANAKSENTKKAYQSDWKDFETWCKSSGLNFLPASPITIAAYLSDKASSLKVASLERRLVAIRQAHAMAGYSFDKNNPCISETLKGIKNTHGTAQMMKAPIVIDELREMVKVLGKDLKGIRDRALLLVGFTGAFRRSELVGIKFEDLKFTKEGAEILLRKSKTDQEGRGITVPIPYGSNPETCPIRALQAWLECSAISEGAIFRGINKHGHISRQGMNPASVALIIKRNEHIGSREANFSGHSLRAGFCTTAASKGVAEHSIMRQSRHKKSDTVKKYIRIANMWQDCAAMKIGL